MNTTEFSIRLLVAILAGLAIGFERQWNHKSAGLRTHTLVAAGAAIFVLLSTGITATGQGDATRIIGQIVVGIGFLGGGVILRNGVSIHGLNSAATIWCSAAVGCLAGMGWYAETLIAAAAIILINLLLRKIEEKLTLRHAKKESN